MQELIQIWFQELFSNFQNIFDPIWTFITFFGEETAWLVIVLILYVAVNKDLAKLIGFSCITSTNCNNIVKDFAKIERPIENEAIRFVSVDNAFVSTEKMKGTYSFPSVHASTSSSVYLGLALKQNDKKIKIALIIFSILIPLSRLYLGVHWPIDVIVGYISGILFFFLFDFLYDKLKNKTILYLIIAALSVVLILVSFDGYTFKGLGSMLGMSVGVILEEKYINFDPKAGKWYHKLIRVIVGLIIILIFKEGLKIVFNKIGDYNILHYIRYAITCFVGIYVYPLLFTTFRKKVLKDDQKN